MNDAGRYMSLTGKQKEKLRAKAHDLKPFIQIGKNGVTQGQINNIKKHLNNHHLIKIKFNEFKSQKEKVSMEISEKTKAEIVEIIGNTLVLYKESIN
jgi:RNA-binding protein